MLFQTERCLQCYINDCERKKQRERRGREIWIEKKTEGERGEEEENKKK